MLLPPDIEQLSDDEGVQRAADAAVNAQIVPAEPPLRNLPPDIEALSDEDPPGHGQVVPGPAERKRKRKAENQKIADVARHRQRLRVVASAVCKCKNSNCRKTFKQDAVQFEALLQQRLLIADLPKQESDKEDSWFKGRHFLLVSSVETIGAAFGIVSEVEQEQRWLHSVGFHLSTFIRI